MKEQGGRVKVFNEIEEFLLKYEGEKPGVALAVIKEGKVVYRKNTGMANIEHKIPITSNTAFNLGSVTKPITAMGIMFLKEEGDLTYDDDITTYFPELSHYCHGVTIRDLLAHTSGIINYYRILDRLDMSDLHLTNEVCYDLLTKEEKLLFEPGEKFDYSNSNYVLLSLLIEKISDKSLNDFLRETLFKPLGMRQAKVFDGGQPIIENRAYGYGTKEGQLHCDYIGALTTGDGCLFASIEDLVAFERALYSDAIVSRQAIEEAFTPGIDSEYGLGWETWKSTATLKQVHHSGGDRGTRCLFVTFPDYRITFILLANFNEFQKDMRPITELLTKIFIQT